MEDPHGASSQPPSQGEGEDKEREREERIAARKKRVAAKLEAKHRAEAGEEPEEQEEQEIDFEKERKSWKQVEKSELRLDKLGTDGTELVTNVVVAQDAKEVTQRHEEEEARNARYERLAAEATAGEERFEEIMKKWTAERSRTIPQELQLLIAQQKAACDAMIDEKNKLINELQQELKGQDDQYVKHLKKQAEEVDLVLERMEEQARVLLRAYRKELEQIESSFSSERTDLIAAQSSEWDEAVDERRGQEQTYLAEREKRIEENEVQLQHLRRRNMEEYNKIKIKLETDIQILQQQIQQMRATFLLNAEKLEYNFQVLKKRDEENTATISQQKRKITRLQDTLNTLNTKLAKQVKTQRSELQALMEEYRKNTEQYREVQKKAKHFKTSDAKRFHDIWVMNEEKVRGLARDVMHADRIIHGQQLGLDWVQPGELASPLAQAASRVRGRLSQATLYASQVLSHTGNMRGKGSGEDPVLKGRGNGKVEGQEAEEMQLQASSALLPPSSRVHPPVVVKRVLELLCNEAEFLLDDKLTRLLAPLEKEEQMLMKLDSMFKALGIHTEEDVQKLVRHFIIDAEEKGEEDHMEGESDTESSLNKGTRTLSWVKQAALKPSLIHPNDVPLAMRRFIELRQAGSKPSSLTPSAFGIMSTAQKELLDGSFWQQITEVLPMEHETGWDALLEGLEIYHTVLTARSKCGSDAETLKRQNNELSLLLQQYMHSRINAELEIPPTFNLAIARGAHS